MMRIILTVACIHKMGGTEKATVDLANLLASDSKNEVIIVSYYKKMSTKYEWSNYNINKTIKVIYFDSKTDYLNLDFRLYKLQQILNSYRFSYYLRKLKPSSVIHSQIENVGKIKNARNNLIIHTSYQAIKQSNLAKYLLKIQKRFLDNIVLLSPEDAEDLNKDLRLKKGVYIPNTLDLEIKMRTNLENKKIIFLGRLNNSVKQIDHIIKAISIVKENQKLGDWKLHIYGEGEDYNFLSELIKKSRLENQAILVGKTSNIDDTLKKSDIMILTSKYEGLPMSLLEGAGSGLALISYDCSNSIKYIIENKINGYIIPQDNIIELASKLQIMIENDDLRKKMGNNSLLIMEGNFDNKNILKKWYGIL